MKWNVPAFAGPLRGAIAAALIMTLLLYVPTPYLVFQPGLAEPAAPLVRSASAEDDESGGEFLLTTVYLSGRSNYLEVLKAQFAPDRELYRKKDVLRGGTIEEYGFRSIVMMENSQSDAVEAAYRLAGVAYDVRPQTVSVSDGGNHDGKSGTFHTGDRIKTVNGVNVSSLAQLQRLLSELAEAEAPEAQVTLKRQGNTVTVTLQPDAHGDGLIDQDELPRVLGVRELTEIRAVLPADPERAVTIETKGVGGPSAGLVFALQAYDRITPGDLTRGLRIAGTGTIDPSGRTGPVGGTALKVVTAHRAGADLFIVTPGNYKEASGKAASLQTDMRVVQAASLREAVKAIESLPLTP